LLITCQAIAIVGLILAYCKRIARVVARQAMSMPAYAPALASPIAAPDRRIAELRRAFQRALRRRPTMLERTAIERAARLTWRGGAGAVDVNPTPDGVVRLDNAATRARSRLEALTGVPPGKRRKPVPLSSFDDLLSGHEP